MAKKKSIIFKSTILTILLASGFTVGTIFSSATANNHESEISFKQEQKKAPLGEDVNIAKSKLNKKFATNLKIPKKLPFRQLKTLGNTINLVENNQDGSPDSSNNLNTDNEKQIYEQYFWGDDGSVISVSVHNFIPDINYGDKAEVENLKLNDNAVAHYFDNGSAQGIDWVDKNTGYEYMVTVFKSESQKVKLSKSSIIDMINSFEITK